MLILVFGCGSDFGIQNVNKMPKSLIGGNVLVMVCFLFFQNIRRLKRHFESILNLLGVDKNHKKRSKMENSNNNWKESIDNEVHFWLTLFTKRVHCMHPKFKSPNKHHDNGLFMCQLNAIQKPLMAHIWLYVFDR